MGEVNTAETANESATDADRATALRTPIAKREEGGSSLSATQLSASDLVNIGHGEAEPGAFIAFRERGALLFPESSSHFFRWRS